MLEWLIPIGGFWFVAVALLGSGPADVEGGSGLGQVIGLIVSYVLFVLVWAGARAAFGGMGFAGRVLLPTVLAVVLYPFLAWVAFKIVGVRLKRGSAAHH